MTHRSKWAFSLTVVLLTFVASLLFLIQKSKQDPYKKLNEIIDQQTSSDRIQKIGHQLSNSPHRAGTDSNRKVGDEILRTLADQGLKTFVEEYSFEFPEPQEAQLHLVLPDQIQFNLHEKKFVEDPWSGVVSDELPYLAFSPDADVTAPLIYANVGSRDDYDFLKSKGIDISKKIALVRARGICRSMKALIAEEEGLAGLLVYPELRDQGFAKTEFPYGPHLNRWVSQRGSMLKYFLYPGDPSAPEAQSVSTLPRIPAIPISPETAGVLLSHIQGEPAPEPWQGWLPQGYRIGTGPGEVRMIFRGKTERRIIRNIFAWLNENAEDKEFLIVGNHYDAWVYGAADPSSGTSVLLEATKILSDLQRENWTPRRKILFAFWDAEEYGMFGSTAWVKKNLPLLKNNLAYINVDTAFRAKDFAAYLSPGLYSSLDDSMEGLKDPESERYFSEIRPEFQNPGFSSDVVPFIRFSGIPVMEIGFGRTYSVYHSAYDDELWLEKFGDPQARYRKVLTQILARSLLRMSTDELVPYNFAELIPFALKSLQELTKQVKNPEYQLQIDSLRKEFDLFHAAAVQVQKYHGNSTHLDSKSRTQANQLLIKAMRAFYDSSRSERSVILEASASLGCVGEALPEISNALSMNNTQQIQIALENAKLSFSESRSYLEKALKIFDSN